MYKNYIYFSKNLIKFLNDNEIEFSIRLNDTDDCFKKNIFNVKEIVFTKNGNHLKYQITNLNRFCTDLDLIGDIINKYKIFMPIDLKRG